MLSESDLALLHRFKECALDLGRGAIDFVGEDNIGEYGAEFGSKGSLVGVVNHGSDQIGGEQVGSELEPGKGQLEGAGQGFDGKRLR